MEESHSEQLKNTDDEPIQFVDLDPPQHKSQRWQFPPRNPWIMRGALLGAVLILVLLIGSPLLPQQMHQPQTPKTIPTPPPHSLTILNIQQNIVIASDNSQTLYALQASNGKVIWHISLPDTLNGPLRLANSILYLALSDTQKNASFIYAIQASNGAIQWRQTLPYATAPYLVLAQDILYIGLQNGIPYALQASNGSLLWHWTHLDSANTILDIQGVTDGRLYLTTQDGLQLMVVGARDGALLWHTFINNRLANLTINQGVTIIQTQNNTLQAWRSADGTALWNSQASGNTGFITTDGQTYLSTLGGTVEALHVSNGALLWQFKLATALYTTITLVHTVLYVTTGDGNIYALQTSNGSVLWHLDLGAPFSLQPVIVQDGQVYVYNDDGTLSALQERSGQLLWRTTVGNLKNLPVPDEIRVFGQNIYFIREDEVLFALASKDGSVQWTYQGILNQPLMSNGHIFVDTYNGSLSSLVERTGATSWSFSGTP